MMAKRRFSPPAEVWTILPTLALLGFAGWVALMASTGNPLGVVIFITGFLAATWRACQRWHALSAEIDEARHRLNRPRRGGGA
ncbi:unnamed protein product [[Actinomadura] parvosata subsp. kistnae]|nr:unnamed protein product [Actinomadura parvosata subsp. kistnae]